MFENLTKKFKDIISAGANSVITEKQFFEFEIARWKYGPKRKMMIDGERYYNGDHDILRRKRTAIGKGGEVEEIKNIPNNRIVDNQFKKMVDQKANFLLSKPITFESGNDKFDEELKLIFNRQFQNRLKNGGVDGYCGGISWIYPYYDDKGNLMFQKFKPYEVLPFWSDAEHTILDCAVRLYEVEVYEGTSLRIQEKVEIFKSDGLYRYDLTNNVLYPDSENPKSDYITIDGKPYNWDEIPLIPFKVNFKEIPLLKCVKGLQDALNLLLSDFVNNMNEDIRNTILVIRNYDGQDLSEFRRNLAVYGAVKVKTVDGADGGIEALKIEVNAENYELILKLIKKAIIENAMGYDAKDDRIGANANQMNLLSMYNDISLDADNMESEYQASFEKLLFFVKHHLKNTGKGDFLSHDVKITFNRDMIQNENDIIDNLVKLGVQLPNELLIGQVPFVDDVQKAIEMLKKEREEESIYNDAFDGLDDGEKE